MTALARLEEQITSLRSELHDLRGSLKLRADGLRVPIQSLEPEPFDVIVPMEAVIRPSNGGFVATFFDANVNASGETETEAFDNLKDMIMATFEEYSALGSDALGPEPARQLAVLQRFIQARQR